MKLSELKNGRKSVDKISLEDKLDVARTMVRLEKRIEARRELNVIEQQIIDRHEADLAEGKVTTVNASGIGEQVVKGLLNRGA